MEDEELVNEFKTAANAVTKLFKLASNGRKIAYERGYVDALEHVLKRLQVDPEGIEAWVQKQLAEISQPDTDMAAAYDPEMDEASNPGDKRNHPASSKAKKPRSD